MRFDDDISSNNEINTVLGDIKKMKDQKSREVKQSMHGDTVRLENASSKEMEVSSA